MKKDYIADSHGGDELKFVEKFWTERWDDKGLNSPDMSVSDEWSVIHPYFEKISPDANIIDVGCGAGEWVNWLTYKGYDVTGVDLSRSTIEKLQNKFPKKKFQTGNLLSLDFPDNHFDILYSWGVFEHFEEGLGKPLKEAFRVLKPDGYLMMSVPFHNLRHLLKDGFSDLFWKYHKNNSISDQSRFYQWRLTKNELLSELCMRGFNVETLKPVHVSSGIHRFLTIDLNFTEGSFTYKAAYKSMYAIKPVLVQMSHMILAVCRKPK